jgi:hypothetical protein
MLLVSVRKRIFWFGKKKGSADEVAAEISRLRTTCVAGEGEAR